MVADSIQNRLDVGDVQSVAEQGLKVVTAQFKGVEPFNWNIFDGFDRMRVLTYSASAQMIVRMLDRYPFAFFECVFGYEGGLRRDDNPSDCSWQHRVDPDLRDTQRRAQWQIR